MELHPYVLCEDSADSEALNGRYVSLNSFIEVTTEAQALKKLQQHQRDRRHRSKSDSDKLRLFKLVPVK